MGIYTNTFLTINNEASASDRGSVVESAIDDMTMDELSNLFEQVKMSALYSLSESSMDDEELVTEGANLDARAIVKKAKKEFTQNLKLCKKEIKAKNYKEAKSYTKKMKVALKDYESQIKKLESTVGSVILGFYATSLRDLCNLTVVTLDTKVAAKTTNPAAKIALHTAGTVGGLLIAPVSMIKALVVSVEEIMGLIKGIQEEKNLPDKINFYKQKMLTILGKLMKVVDDMDKLIDKKAAEDK